MGRWKNDEEFSIESQVNKPPGVLLNAVKLLKSDHDLGQGKMSWYIQEAARASSERKALKEYQFPGRGEKRLNETRTNMSFTMVGERGHEIFTAL